MSNYVKFENNLSLNVYKANTFSKRFLGYMFRKNPHKEGILFNPCNSIHTYFMKFSIDVLFINKNMEIVKKVENLIPGKIILPVKGATMVIETKAGMLNLVECGSKISLL